MRWSVLLPLDMFSHILSFVLICSLCLAGRKDKQQSSLKWDRKQIWKGIKARFFVLKSLKDFQDWTVVGGCEFMFTRWGVFGSNIPASPQSATNPKLAHPLHRRNYGKPLHQRFAGFLRKTSPSGFMGFYGFPNGWFSTWVSRRGMKEEVKRPWRASS